MHLQRVCRLRFGQSGGGDTEFGSGSLLVCGTAFAPDAAAPDDKSDDDQDEDEAADEDVWPTRENLLVVP